MSEWIDVCKVDELKPDTFRLVNFDDIEVMVCHVNNNFYTIEDICTHDGGPLSDGELVGCEIICPRHGAKFDIRDGAVTTPPAYEDLRTFPTRIHEGIVQVRDDRWD